jgi:hypothetical protein
VAMVLLNAAKLKVSAADMRASRGMGPILPSKRPKGASNAPVNGMPTPGIKKGGVVKKQKAKK